MADRYLRASGNWNGPVWAATSGGAAGSASTPTSDDVVYIAANFTVTLTDDAVCDFLMHTNGTINLSSYTLTCGGIMSSGSTARTLNLQSGTIDIHTGGDTGFNLSGSNLTFNAGTSLITINLDKGSYCQFWTLSETFNDVRINLGYSSSSTFIDITGSPTFRSLIIQSKNSAAHTVTFDQYANIQITKLIAIGASSSNRITIKNSDDSDPDDSLFSFAPGGSSYGQNVNMRMYGDDTFVPLYIGSNSIAGGSNWLLQDPPKISTLVDPLTTAPESNPNWDTTGTITQGSAGVGGGGYGVPLNGSMTSTDTYDLVDSELIFERSTDNNGLPFPNGGLFGIEALGDISGFSGRVGAWSEKIEGGGSGIIFDIAYASQYGDTFPAGAAMFAYPVTDSKFIRIKIEGDTLTVGSSDDGSSWAITQTKTLDAFEKELFRSVRVRGVRGVQYVGSINMLPKPKNTGNFLAFFTP